MKFSTLLRQLVGESTPGRTVICITTEEGSSVQAAIPSRVLEVFVRLLEATAAGGVAVLGVGEALSPQDAAQLLGVSRSFLTRQMDAGGLPFHLVGSHRRIRIEDLLAFEGQRYAGHAAATKLVNNVNGRRGPQTRSPMLRRAVPLPGQGIE